MWDEICQNFHVGRNLFGTKSVTPFLAKFRSKLKFFSLLGHFLKIFEKFCVQSNLFNLINLFNLVIFEKKLYCQIQKCLGEFFCQNCFEIKKL